MVLSPPHRKYQFILTPISLRKTNGLGGNVWNRNTRNLCNSTSLNSISKLYCWEYLWRSRKHWWSTLDCCMNRSDMSWNFFSAFIIKEASKDATVIKGENSKVPRRKTSWKENQARTGENQGESSKKQSSATQNSVTIMTRVVMPRSVVGYFILS